MLLFNGIQVKNGKREKYQIHYLLCESYGLALQFLQKNDFILEHAITDIKSHINNLYQDFSQNNKSKKLTERLAHKKKFHSTVAQKMRAKEIIEFFERYKENATFLFDSLKILLKDLSIEKKWLEIESLFTNQKSLKQDTSEQKNREFLEEFVLFVMLFFADQSKKIPPPNLVLNFVYQNFPKHNWSATDCSQNLRPQEWIFDEKYGSVFFLLENLWKYSYPKNSLQSTSIATNKSSLKNNELSSSVEENIYNESTIQKIVLRYQENASTKQLFDNSIDVVMRIFMQHLLKKYQSKSINHFMAILYQIHKNYDSNKNTLKNCFFDWEFHFQLILSSPKKNLLKQWEISQEVLQEFQKIQAVRTVKKKNRLFEIHNPLIQTMSKIYALEDQFLKKNLQQNKLYLKIDPCLIPTKDNPLQFAASLRFIPKSLFQENIKTYPFLILLCVYLYDCWLYEFPKWKGKLSRKMDDLIVGSCIRISKSGKYRTAQRIRSAIQFLKQKKYIENYKISSLCKNSLETVYLISAPTELHKKLIAQSLI